MLRHGVSVLCLLLAIFTGLQWVRSYTFEDTVYIHRDGPNEYSWSITTISGILVIQGAKPQWPQRLPEFTFESINLSVNDPPASQVAHAIGLLSSKNALIFDLYGIATKPYGWPQFAVMLPIWMALLVVLLFPMCDGLFLLRKCLRRSIAICPRCHHDLRASTATCPECGTPTTRPTDKLPA